MSAARCGGYDVARDGVSIVVTCAVCPPTTLTLDQASRLVDPVLGLDGPLGRFHTTAPAGERRRLAALLRAAIEDTMSRTSHKRGTFDDKQNYPTPLDLVEVLVSLLPTIHDNPGPVFEPSAGIGNFAVGLAEVYGRRLVAVNDPYDWPQLDAVVREYNLRRLTSRLEDVTRADIRPVLIAGNPPFSLWIQHVQAALHLLAEGGILAYVLPSGAFNPKRLARSGVPLTDTIPLPFYEVSFRERPQYAAAAGRSRGSDSNEHSMFLWRLDDDPGRVSWRKALVSWQAPGVIGWEPDDAHLERVYLDIWRDTGRDVWPGRIPLVKRG